MKIFNRILFLIVGCLPFCFSTISAQTVDEWQQDGKIVFQYKPELNVQLPMFDKKHVDYENVPSFSSLIAPFGITAIVQLHPDIRDEKLINTYQVEFTEIHKIKELINIIAAFENVEYAEPKALHKHCLTPNDTYYNSTYQWGLFKISAGQAWDISTGSSSIVVAVTDNAIKTTHPDLTNKLIAGYDVAEGDSDPNPAGGNDGEHGTHVSGIVGAQSNNSAGVASIGYNTSVMPVKIGRDSDGALTAGYEGITWAADNGAHVINMSWGGGTAGTYGQNVINYAYNLGCIIVAAAGNDNASTMFYPAAYENVISVASTSSTDAKSSFSQYGTWIDISSPGSNIYSTVPNTSYAYMSGTSMASPMVAGLVGLMLSVNPTLPQADVIDCLLNTADNIDAQNSGYIGMLGSGRIDAYAALQCMQSSAVSLDAGVLQIQQPTGTICNATITPKVLLKNFGMNTLTNVAIKYQVDAGAVQNYNWTGSLQQGQSILVSLPDITPAAGSHTFTAYTQNPNGGTDETPTNDQKQTTFTVFSAGVGLPFTEDFESGTFATNNWTLINPDGLTTWEIATVAGTTPGSKAATMNFFNYSATGQRDGMVTPPINLSGYQSAEMTFKHAYKRYDSSSSDSLIIYVSTDCGVNYQRVLALGENGTGIFATGYTSTTEFTPAVANDWCSGTVGAACQTVDLTPFVGFSNVVVKFEGYNNYGNNLYIDNINIDGDPLTTAPTIQMNTSATSICEGGQITFTDQSTPAVLSREWTFESGTPGSSTSASQLVTYNTAGVWDVTLEATNTYGTSSNTFANHITVTAPPTPPTVEQNGSVLSVTVAGGLTVQWYRNGAIIPGATSNTYQVTQIGNYKAKITNAQNCYSFTNEVTVNPTGIDDYEFETNSIFLFPNPAEDIVYVMLGTTVMKDTQLEVCDLTGKVVASYTVKAGDQKVQINVSILAQGTYLVRLQGRTWSNTERLLINR